MKKKTFKCKLTNLIADRHLCSEKLEKNVRKLKIEKKN